MPIQEKELKPLYQFIRIIWFNRKQLLIFNTLVMIVTILYLFSLPKWYRSTALVLVQVDKNSFNLSSAISQMMPFNMSIDQNDEIIKMISLLNSRNMADRVIDKFDLMNAYELERRDDAYRTLAANTSFIDNNDGTISIVCTYKEDPVKAAEMAQFYHQELEKLSMEISQKQSSIFRQLLETTYTLRLEKLKKLQDGFAEYRLQTGIIEIESQTSASMKALSEMEIEKIKLEVQLSYMNKVTTSNYVEVKKTKEMIASYQQKINDFKNGTNYSNVAINMLPKESIKYYRYAVDINIEGRIIEFLTLQLEQAKLEERKVGTNLFLLDKPKPADRKFKPKRMTQLIIVMFFSLIGSIVYYRIKDYYRKNYSVIKTIFRS